MSYIDSIQTYHPLTFEHIIRTAWENVPHEYKSRPWACPGLNHGTARLDNDAQLCCYLAAYGEMHKGRLECAINQFPFNNIDSNCEIMTDSIINEKNLNLSSIIVRLEYGDNSFLFMGDRRN